MADAGSTKGDNYPGLEGLRRPIHPQFRLDSFKLAKENPLARQPHSNFEFFNRIGLLRFLNVLARWTELADRTIIDHSYSPYLWLGIEASLFATGALLLARSRWIFLPLLLHVTLSACRSFGFGHAVVIANHDYLNWSGEIAVLGFSLWLLLNRRLR